MLYCSVIMKMFFPKSNSEQEENVDIPCSPLPPYYSLEDCGEWPAKITDDIRQLLVKNGPVQVKHFNFPIDSNSGRRFKAANYNAKLPN